MKANEKKCPRCAEVIKKEALICKHCGFEFPAEQIAAEKQREQKQNTNGAIGCVAVFGLLVLIGMCSSGKDENISTGNETAIKAISPAEAKATEQRNKAQIAVKLKEVQKLPASDVEGNARLYSELVELAPGNASYVFKRDHYNSILEKAARFADHPEEALEITNFNWEKGGFDSVQLVRFTVKNSAPFAIKDFTLECNHQGPSGTDMDSNTRVVYELVPANGTRRVKEVNMGFINSQVTTSRCSITDAKRA